MNALAQTVYQRVYPNLVKGSQEVNHNNISFNITFDVQAAPQFDLSDGTAVVQQTLQTWLQEQQQGKISPSDLAILNELLKHVQTFQVHFPKLSITLSGGTINTNFQLDLHAYSYIIVSGDRATLQPFKVTAESTGNTLNDWFVTNIIVPQIFKLASSLLEGIQIPSLSFSNVKLSTLAIGIVNHQIIAVTNLVSKGAPASFPTQQAFPQQNFFAMLSQDVFQAAASALPPHDIGSHGEKGSWPFKAHYNGDFVIYNPQARINGIGLDIYFDLRATIGAGVAVFTDIGLCFSGNAAPKPSAHTSLHVNGNKLDVVADSVSTFTVVVTPCGEIATKVLSWMVEFIVVGITAATTAGISSFLKNIYFTSFQIPSYPISISGHNLTAQPANISLSNTDNYLTLNGNLTLS
jgi:hypothetical protein